MSTPYTLLVDKLCSIFAFDTWIVQVHHLRTCISKISSYLRYSVTVQTGLCRSWSETKRTGFLELRIIFDFYFSLFLGTIGDWKNHFTVAENEQFDELLERELKESYLKFTYTIDL